MDRQDIIRMAREAGLAYGPDEKPLGSVTRFAALVAAAEREACANLLLNVDLSSMDADHRLQSWTATVLLNFSAAIRARGER
jgi:hypothetical protein